MMNPDVVKIINSYLDLKFFEEEILHKSWHYLLVNNLLTFELLESKILSLTFGGEQTDKIFSLDRLKSRLHDLISKIAKNKKGPQEKSSLLKAMKMAFGFEND